MFNQLVEEYGEEEFIYLNYHHGAWVNPFSEERVATYFDLPQVSGVYPTMFFDGAQDFVEGFNGGTYSEYNSIIQQHVGTESPFALDATIWRTGDDFFVKGYVTLEDDIDYDNLTVHMAVLEEHVYHEGYDEFKVVRMMLDDHELEISESGQSVCIQREFTRDVLWYPENLSVVIFVQQDDEALAYPILQAKKFDDILLYSDFYTYSYKTGHMPLEVQFTSLSTGTLPPTSWAWDFNNDGITDSNEENPIWIFQEPGFYTVSLQVANDSLSLSRARQDYINVFDGESALFFNGNSFVSCGNPSAFNFDDKFTLEAWVNPTEWSIGTILDKEAYSMNLVGDAGYSPYNDNSLIFAMIHESGAHSFINSSENSIVLDEWQHIAVTYDAAFSEAKLFINGIESPLTTVLPPDGNLVGNLNNPLIIASQFSGVIDDIRLWDRVRTPSEILANIGHTIGQEQNLVGYWQLNEGNGIILQDGSGNGHNASPDNTQWVQGTPFYPTKINENYFQSLPIHSSILHQNYPNPFNPNTTIAFQLPEGTRHAVTLRVYDVSGKFIKALINEPMEAGYYSAMWNGTDDFGKPVGSGVYLYRIETNGYTETKQCLLLK